MALGSPAAAAALFAVASTDAGTAVPAAVMAALMVGSVAPVMPVIVKRSE